jgi:aromatic ring-opening dioxygenase LigB subunit
MPLVYACIAPHGGHLLNAPDRQNRVPECRAAMQVIRQNMAAAAPDTIVIVTPHGISIPGKLTIAATETAYGRLDDLEVKAKIDSDLSIAWKEAAVEEGVNAVLIAPQDESTPFPLDWGVTIPLSLIDPDGNLPSVVACPGQNVDRESYLMAGEALVAASSGKRIALIASADQGHGHSKDGPYGFAPESAEYDHAMRSAIELDDLSKLLSWHNHWIDAALADSYFQTLILHAAQTKAGLKGQFLAYEVDSYFGMICASYTSG